MLTPKNIKARTAIEYFKQGYYQKGKWLGKGASVLGLKGEIKSDRVYKNIVKGFSPDGSKRLNKREVHSDKRKAAVDCTFAAPKSVSLCALVGGNERLIKAHLKAVEKVLELLETKYAASRVMLDGKTQEVVTTGNLVIAKYDHIESRELNPHLHSHCLVMNMTQLPNGEWYSHLNDEIFRNQKLLGMAYQHYLAIEVQKLGYEIETRSHGQFEIKGYSEAELGDFSKRRKQILKVAGASSSWAEREKAWRKTRRTKENVSPEELKAKWLEEAAALKLNIVKPGQPKPEAELTEVDQKIFTDALAYCSERQVAFKAEEIYKFILSESKPLDVAKIQPLIDRSEDLIRLQEKNGLRYTTMAAVERELATINLMKAGQGKVSAISHPEIVKAHLEQTSLNTGQQQAVMMTLTTTDSFIAWQGVAGAGKTFALKEVLSLAHKQGYRVKGFAPSAKASNVLGQELETQTQTVARLLASKPPNEIEHHQIWIVDEAGLLSAKDAKSLLQRATNEQARVILVGDTKQLSAVEAGNPFKSLQQAGIETAYLNESQRQKDSPQLKLAIDLLAQGRVEAGFARLKEIECIQKVTRETKFDEIIKAYLKATPEQRAKTLVLAGTNVERLELTGTLRKALQAEGSLGSDVTLTQLKSKDLREVQLGYTSHFALGDLVMPLRNYKRKGLEKGELYEVIGTTTDTIKLIAPDGRELNVGLDFKKAVYQREQIEIAVGDRLVWKKNDHQKGQVNGLEVTVVAINGNTVKVIDAEGKTQTLDLTRPHHLDHGIVRTTFSAQGETADCVFVAADSTIGKESFYVASSRARSKLRFFTTNENELLQWAIRSRAQENPLELIRNQVQLIQHEQLVVVGQSQTTSNISVTSPAPITRTAKLETRHPQRLTPKPARRTEPSESSQPSSSITPALTPQGIPKPKIPTTPFWTPTPAGAPPRQIEEKHWRELVEGSAINPALVEPNVYSVSGRGVYERLLSTKLEKIGSGQYVTQPAAKLMKAYEQVADGGWWAESGIDARSLPDLKPGEKPSNKLWGCFKADNPRVDADKSQRKGKTEYIKYEHPLAEERQLFLFDVPDALAQRIYDKYGIEPTDAEKQSGFWYIVHRYNLPITLAEGAKKTLSSLSQGEITIGLSGVNGGYFAKDNQKNKLEQRVLHPELKIFATPGRDFRFAFDQDIKESTIWNVRRDMVRIGELLELEGSNVRVVQWQGDKGLDDLIVNQSPWAYAIAGANSIPLVWEAQKHYRAEYVKLSKKVSSARPAMSREAIDVEIYHQASLKGDIRDGARTIAQSDCVRSFKEGLPKHEVEHRTLEYIGHIEQLLAEQKRLHVERFKQQVASPTPDLQPQTASEESQSQTTPPDFNDGQQWVRVETDKPLLLQYNNQLGVVVGYIRVAGSEQVIVKIGKYTPGFDNSELVQLSPDQSTNPNSKQNSNPTNQENHDISPANPELATPECGNQRHRIAEREDRADGRKHPQPDGEDRFIREQQQAFERESWTPRNHPEPKPERVDNRVEQLLAAINQYVETGQAGQAEQIGGNLERFYRSFAEPRLSSLGAEKLTSADGQQDGTILDSPRIDARIDPQITRSQITRQCLNAIAEYIEQKSIESTLIETLPALTQKLNQLTHKPTEVTGLDESLQAQAIAAIAEYIEQQSIETTIIENLPALTQKLNQLSKQLTQTERLDESLQTQAVEAIAEYIEQKSIESTLIETLPALTQKLNQLTHKPTQTARLTDSLQTQAIDAIAEYVERRGIESALIETLPALTHTLNQLTHKPTQLEPLDKSLQAQAIDAIAQYIEQQSIEATLIETLPALTQKLNQLTEQKFDQTEQPDESLQAQAIDANAGYLEQAAIEAQLLQAAESLTKQMDDQISNSLPQEISATGQQAIEVGSNFIEQSAVESCVDSPALHNLVAQLFQLPRLQLTAQFQQIEAAISDYQTQLQNLVQVQVIESLAEAIANYHDQIAVDEFITPDFQQLVQRLAQVGHSQLTEQFQQIETVIQQVTNFGKGEDRPTRNTNNQDDLQVDKPGLPHAGETSDNQTRLVSAKEASFIEQHEMVERLTDRDFLELYQNVAKYFKAAPLSLPANADRQLAENEVKQFVNQINDLRQKQVEQIVIVESMQKSRFRAWNKKYNTALTQVQETTSLINQLIIQKDQKENQIKEWSEQDKVYQVWKHNPYTTEMQTLVEVFSQPLMQERLTQIQQELEKATKILDCNYNKHQNRQNDKEISL